MAKLYAFVKAATVIGISVYCFVYLLSCATPFINPIYCYFFTFLALGFPYLLTGMLAVLLCSLFFYRKYSFVFLFLILLGYKNILATTGLHFPKKYHEQKETGSIRLLSWNVNDFINNGRLHDSINSPRRQIMSFIKQSNADVVCMQDFESYLENEYFVSNVKYMVDTLHYTYFYISTDYDFRLNHDVAYKYGTAIFSKYPIIDSDRFAYANKHYPEHLMYATIKINNKAIRFYTTHLRSMNLHRDGKNPQITDYSFFKDDTTVIFYKSKFEKLRYYDSVHVLQAKLIKEQLDKCTLPFVFCADLNSVPSSYVYQYISQGLDDAFLQNQSGWGNTYPGISPFLRIDITLLSKELYAKQYYCPMFLASDHLPVLTDIAIYK
ncbi:endonuclease/exonuclease/phosphatase family protein [Parasediminibacterium sp. JCM 36343]|uniref:endonuclease/exonuclease/phosphatase family protein n=1 Tax=Parasediminibacterium sp. JCM 36343 TaxID=3374279 RepID=UPI00397AB7F1